MTVLPCDGGGCVNSMVWVRRRCAALRGGALRRSLTGQLAAPTCFHNRPDAIHCKSTELLGRWDTPTGINTLNLRSACPSTCYPIFPLFSVIVLMQSNSTQLETYTRPTSHSHFPKLPSYPIATQITRFKCIPLRHCIS